MGVFGWPVTPSSAYSIDLILSSLSKETRFACDNLRWYRWELPYSRSLSELRDRTWKRWWPLERHDDWCSQKGNNGSKPRPFRHKKSSDRIKRHRRKLLNYDLILTYLKSAALFTCIQTSHASWCRNTTTKNRQLFRPSTALWIMTEWITCTSYYSRGRGRGNHLCGLGLWSLTSLSSPPAPHRKISLSSDLPFANRTASTPCFAFNS